MDRLDAMTILLAIVDHGSFSAAARQLGIPLPTVSRKIADLETHLKARLLLRSTRHLALTEAGQAFVAASRRIVEEVQQAERDAAGEYAAPRGHLTISAPLVFGRMHLMPVINDFLLDYPDITITLGLADRIAELIDEHIDLALRIGTLPDSALVAVKVGSIGRVVCASPAYLERHGVPATPAELATHACISFTGLNQPRQWEFGGANGHAPQRVAVQPRLMVNTAEAAIDAANAGLGLTCVLSYQVADALRRGTLRSVLAAYAPPPFPVQLVHASRSPLPLKLRAFVDFAAARLRAIDYAQPLTPDGAA